MSLATNTQSNTRPKLLFQLISAIGDVNCSLSPKGFRSATIELIRDIDLAGVFIEFKSGTLTFVGSPEKRLLRDLWDQYGLLAVCSLRVSYLDRTTQTYTAFSNDFVLDFSEYNEAKVTKSRNGIRIKAESTGFAKKLKDRKKRKVDLTRTVSQGGYNIPQLFHWAALKKSFTISEVNAFKRGNLASTTSATKSIVNADTIIVPFNIISSDFDETIGTLFEINDPIDETRAFFRDATEAKDIVIDESFTINVKSGSSSKLFITFIVAKVASDGTTLTTLQTDVIRTTDGDHTLSYSDTVSLLTDESVIIYGTVNGIGTADFDFQVTDNQITEGVISSPGKTIETYPVYEAMERCLQLILDTQFPLYSEFLGRTDVAKNLAGDLYASEDQERFAQVFNGLLARGLILSTPDNTFTTNFTDLMSSYNALWNVGIAPEVVDGEDRMVLEERSSFYIDSVGMDLSARINDIEIEYEVLSELAYSEIESGFKSFDYEIINGRGEYNTKNSRTSLIPKDNKFNNISTARGDTMGLALLLTKPIYGDGTNDPTGSTDTKADKDIFIFKSQRNASKWKIETDENRQVVDNTSLFEDGSFNLFFTPTVNLYRHNYELASGLDKEKNSYLRFQDSDKSQTLITTDGVTEIEESEDILVDDLGDPKWMPAQYIVSLPFYESDIATLITNKYKLIKLSDTKQGWLLKAKYKIASNEIELTILQKFE